MLEHSHPRLLTLPPADGFAFISSICIAQCYVSGSALALGMGQDDDDTANVLWLSKRLPLLSQWICFSLM